MEKINVAELLKDCPKGMELYSPLCGKCAFDHIHFGTIICKTQNNQDITFTRNGYYMLPVSDDCECVIFPSKDQRDWSKFQKPFKDGDIISNDKYVAIFYKIGTPRGCKSPNVVYYHCFYSKQYHEFRGKLDFGIGCSTEFKYATEEEEEKLFDAIKDNGCRWNPETKTLEKLIEPKFKVGDRVKKNTDYISGIVTDIFNDSFKVTYDGGCCSYVQFNYQHEWELVSDKFDITTLKPFDKVLVAHKKGEWHIQFFEKYSPTSKFPFICIGGSAYQKCVPYEENKHLMNTTNDCDEFYTIW